MAVGSWRYYEREVTRGRENYYTGPGEEPGRWIGAGAEQLGLSGEVTAEQLGRLFDHGCHPVTAEVLGRGFVHFPNRSTVTGYSLSFSPPKSVSLLWALGDETTSTVVRAAHDRAVSAAVSFLEQHSCFSRTGKAGVFQVDATGFVAAAFVHTTSRALDPQLHTHILVANKTLCRDGVWRALDGRELYTMQKPGGMVYNAALRAELERSLGVAFHPVDGNGQADIVGVPAELIGRFSARRRQVLTNGEARISELEALLGRPLSDGERAEQYQRAALDGRPTKCPEGETPAELRARWEREALDAGYPTASWIPDTIERQAPTVSQIVDTAVVEQVVAALIDEHATFGRAEILKQVIPLAPAGLRDSDTVRTWVEKTVTEVLAHPQIVTLSCPLLNETPAELRRADGQAMAERHGQRRWTTRLTLAREALVLDTARQGLAAGIGVVNPVAISEAVKATGLSGDQTDAVWRLCLAGDRIAVLVGPAGAGKTRTMTAVAAAWETAGHRVYGAAVSAKAAQVLQEETGVEADTVARLLVREERGELPLRAGDVIVVDEAGMVTTADLAHLATIATGFDLKLVLVGDHHQLAPVGAGGLFRLLAEETHAAELETVRRFREPWEQAASLKLRAGDPSVIPTYRDNDRIHGGNREQMLDQALTQWRAATMAGESVVVLAADRATVEEFATRARAVRVAAGEVEPGGVLAGGQLLGVGDQVVTGRNDRTLRTVTGHWVRNGDRWTIAARHGDGSVSVDSVDGHQQVWLPAEYVAEHTRLAYAMTVHKAQGMTVDRSILLVDDNLTRELLYVGLTRGRHTNTAQVIVETVDDHQAVTPRTPEEVLMAALTRRGVQQSATEVMREQLSRADDLALLYPLLEQARQHIDRHAGPDRALEIQRFRHQAEPLVVLLAQRKLVNDELDDLRAQLDRVKNRVGQIRPTILAAGSTHWWQRPPRKTVDALKPELDELCHQRSQLQNDAGRLRAEADRISGRLAIAGRAAEAIPEATDAQARRDEWTLDHPNETSWHDTLRQRISTRTTELGQQALLTRPAHLVDLLGRPGAMLDTEQWAHAAGHIEAYRERWRLQPGELDLSHAKSPSQLQHWRLMELTLPDAAAAHLEHRSQAERSQGIELGL